MGTTQSTETRTTSEHYIDAEAINLNINHERPNDTKYNKMYIVYQRINGVSRIYTLNIKILDDRIFVYVTNELTGKTGLAHVNKIYSVPDTTDPLFYLKYVQVSRDFRLISIPENDTINIYDLFGLINRNTLQHVDSFDLVSSSTDKPYKCILCKDLFMMVCADTNTNTNTNHYTSLITTNHTIKLDTNMDRSCLKFSPNGRYVVVYDKDKRQLLLCNTINNPVFTPLPINIDGIVPNTICLSDDGRLLFYAVLTDTQITFSMYDVSRNYGYTIHKIAVNPTVISFILNTRYHLLNYNKFSNIDLVSETAYNYLYALVGWNQSTSTSTFTITSVFYWLIRSSNDIHGPFFVDMPVDNVNYAYNNGYMFIYKTPNNITVYDLNKVVPIKFAMLLATNTKKTLDILYIKEYPKVRKDYCTYVDIMGSDDSIVRYKLSDYMSFFLSIKSSIKSSEVTKESNIFQMRVNANIDIYDSDKSFVIYQALIEGRLSPFEIVSNMFSIQKSTGRHNMMTELTDHLYEYTRVIALKEKADGDIDRSGVNHIKAIYTGYVFVVLILQYYSMMFKTTTCSKKIKFDIINTFNANFPAFKDFMTESLNVMLGEIEQI